VVNLNLTLLDSLREGTLPCLQLPFLLYEFYLKFQTALAASDLASWSLIILVHMLVLSANDGVHLLILHFNTMTGFPQWDNPQLNRLIETLFAEAHIVSRHR
jgi:glucose-6-phosphate-specific signal transduction histidine kinase